MHTDTNSLSRPRLCFVAPHAYPVLSGRTDITWIGGAEVQQVFIARGLASLGFDVSMLSLDYGQEDGVRIDGVTVYRAFRRGAGVPGLRFISPRLTSLWTGMRRADADIYYQRGAGLLTGVVVTFCKLKSRQSVFAVAGETKIRRARDRWIFAYGARRADRVLVQNIAQGEHVRTVFGRQYEIIPNFYTRMDRPEQLARNQILWVATLRPLKRPELFLDLAESLPEYEFTMIGGAAAGHGAYFDQIKARAEKLRNVRFTGFLPYHRADEYFDHATLLVNTSETEGFPNTFLQAWARGIPTLSFIDSGARADGEPVGRIAATWQDLHDITVAMMSSASLRNTEGDRCREYFEKQHSAATVLRAYERLFMKMHRTAAARA